MQEAFNLYLIIFGVLLAACFIGYVAESIQTKHKRQQWQKMLDDSQRREHRPTTGRGIYR